MASAALPSSPVQCVIFRVGRTLQALSIDDVREILVPGSLTPSPGAPPHVLGLTQVRGQAIPVIDLAARLGLGHAETSPNRRLIVVSAGEGAAALLVDGVEEVTTARPEEFELVRIPGATRRVVLKHRDELVGWLVSAELVEPGQERAALAA
jgi:chemotaxis signal transduction protein